MLFETAKEIVKAIPLRKKKKKKPGPDVKPIDLDNPK
jgi:hypothetical protein